MLVHEYNAACEVAIEKYFGDMHKIMDDTSRLQSLQSYYNLACSIYSMARFDDLFTGLDRHVKVVMWMLENQRLVTRYWRLKTEHERIMQDYTDVCNMQAATTTKIAAMQTEYPQLGRALGVTYWRRNR